MLLFVEWQIFLNWNLTPIYLPLLVEASFDRQPSNEGSFFRPAGREKAGDESGGNKPVCTATECYIFNSVLGNKYAGYSHKLPDKLQTQSISMRQAMNRKKTTGDTLFSRFQIIVGLQIEPILRRLLKGFGEKQG